MKLIFWGWEFKDRTKLGLQFKLITFDTTGKKKHGLKIDTSWNYESYSEPFKMSLLAFQVKAKFFPRLDFHLDSVFKSPPSSCTTYPGFLHSGSLSVPLHYRLLPPQWFCHTVSPFRAPFHWMSLTWRKSSEFPDKVRSIHYVVSMHHDFFVAFASQDMVLDVFHHLVTTNFLHYTWSSLRTDSHLVVVLSLLYPNN